MCVGGNGMSQLKTVQYYKNNHCYFAYKLIIDSLKYFDAEASKLSEFQQPLVYILILLTMHCFSDRKGLPHIKVR